MNLKKMKPGMILGITLALLLILPVKSWAIPSFARQTNLPCSSCHTMFPELTAFGRMFKLNGYTLTAAQTVKAQDEAGVSTLNLLKSFPLSVAYQAAYTYTNKTVPGKQNNTVSNPKELSVFFGGQITPNLGAFIQVTYDDQEGSFGFDMIDLRYSKQTTVGENSLIYGFTLTNMMTMQDVWNSVPAWEFPYTSSEVTPTPGAATLLEGGHSMDFASLGAYGLWNNLIYAEFSVYRTVHQGGPSPLDASSMGTVKSIAPYWRLAVQKQWDTDYLEIGTYGTTADVIPMGITGSTDNYTDIAFDANYEKALDNNSIEVHSRWIRESQKLNATFAAGGASHLDNTLNSFKVNGSYYINHKYGFTAGYFATSGDNDNLLYTPGAVDGSRVGQPNSNGFTFELDYMPWLNTKFGVQYVLYSKFNGASNNYDGSGRNASDNNSIMLVSWFGF